jgi:hypothetical protein
MDNNNSAKTGGIGLSGLTLLWGLVTQALSWAGVISWPWVAIWGPFLAILAIDVAVLVVLGIIVLVAYVKG